MARISFHPGVWVGSLGLIFGGVFAVLSATLTNHSLINAGWLSIALGVALAMWGIKFDGEHWWALTWRKCGLVFRQPIWPVGNLYIGRILVSDSVLDVDHYLDLTVRAHNGTSRALCYSGVTGFPRVEFLLNGNGAGGFDLQPPTFMFGDAPCAAGGEFFLNFRIALTPQQVATFREQQTAGAIPQIFFDSMNIAISAQRKKPQRLPLWDGVSLFNGVVNGQIVRVVCHASSHSTASLG